MARMAEFYVGKLVSLMNSASFTDVSRPFVKEGEGRKSALSLWRTRPLANLPAV